MATLVTLARNPYPVPDLSREGSWIPRGPVLGEGVEIAGDGRWYADLQPHERLFAHHTLNSIRKDRRLVRPQVPHDSLDLSLSSVYVHNDDTLVPKTYVAMQPETLGKETWRVLRNQIKIYTKLPVKLGHPIKYGQSVATTRVDEANGEVEDGGRRIPRRHPSSSKLSIDGPHTDRTNPGYSRKIDGTFFGI